MPTSSPPATPHAASDGGLPRSQSLLVAALVGGAIAVVQRQDAQSATGRCRGGHAHRSDRGAGRPRRVAAGDAARRGSAPDDRGLPPVRHAATRSALLSTFTDEPRSTTPTVFPVRPAARASSCPTACRHTPSISTAGCARTGSKTDRSAMPYRPSAPRRIVQRCWWHRPTVVSSPKHRGPSSSDGPTEVGIFDTATGHLAVRADRRRRHGVVGRVHRRWRLDLRWRSARKLAWSSSTAPRGRRSHRARESPCLPMDYGVWPPEPAAGGCRSDPLAISGRGRERQRRHRRLGRRLAADVRRRHVRAEPHDRDPTRRRHPRSGRSTMGRSSPPADGDRARRSRHRGGRVAARPGRLVDR